MAARQTDSGRSSPEPAPTGHRRRSGGVTRRLQVPGQQHQIISDFDPFVSSDNHELAKPLKSQSEGLRERTKSRTPTHSPPSSRKHSPNATRRTNGSPSNSRSRLMARLPTKTGSKAKLNQAQAYPERKPTGEANSALLDIVQHSVVSTELERRKEEYCNREPIRVFIGTWNVNGKSPDEQLTPYIGRASCQPQEDAPGKKKDLPHLLVVG